MTSVPYSRRYVLITAAKNEQAYISSTISAVLRQTIQPVRWIIVSDGSTDGTDEIVRRYAAENPFIQFLRRESSADKANFASKVYALRIGYEKLTGLDYDFLGHLDADISFGEGYYENVMDRFARNPRLGIAGGFVYEAQRGRFVNRKSNSNRSVAGGIQLFRRECYEVIGGFIPLKCGGEDWYAEIVARMNGWDVEAFPDCIAFHHKSGKTVRGAIKEFLREGAMDYALGSHPAFEIIKCIYRLKEKPYLLSSMLRLARFTLAYLRREEKQIPSVVAEYLRKEQMARVTSGILSILRVSGMRRKISKAYEYTWPGTKKAR